MSDLQQTPAASTGAQPDHGRRRVLAGLGLLAATPLLSPFARARGFDDPFTLGVAAGDPPADGMVLWIRLAPQPLAADGQGGLREAVPVRWSVATDPGMAQVVQRGRGGPRRIRAGAMRCMWR